MSWVTVIWSMIASACLTLAAIHFVIWCQRRTVWANLLFTLTSVGVAVYAGAELSMMRSETPEEFAAALRWLHVPTWVIVVSLVGFVRLHLQAGRRWMAWGVFALRSLALLLNFLVGQNLNYREVTRLRHISFLGDTVSVGVGVPNPWMLVGQLSLLLLVIFAVDATITAWRRGDRRQAMGTAGSIVFFSLTGMAQSVLVFWWMVDFPLTESVFFLGIVVAMGYEMSLETLRAAQVVQELQESERRLAMAADAAKLGIWIRDLVRNEIWASDRWRALFGYTKTEPLELNQILQRLYPEDREAVRQTLAKAVTEGGYEVDYRIVLPDGGMRWISSRGRVESNGQNKPTMVRDISFDITERKQTEQHVRMVVEASSSAMIIVNSQGRVTLANARAETIFGYHREELLGEPIEILVPDYARPDHPSYRQGYSALPEARAMGAGRELFGRRKDGSLVPVEIGLDPIRTPDGLFVLASIIDITERRRSEREKEELRQSVAHAGRVTMLGQLASSLAHELGQPLGAILRNAETAEVLLESDAPDLEELRAIVADIRKDDHRAGDVINGLRSLLKRRSLESNAIAVEQLTNEVVALAVFDASARRIKLTVNVPPGLPPVRGDRVHLQQVLLNLIMNGMDAVSSETDGTREVKVHARLNENGMIEIAVSDTGHGVPPEKLGNLFEPFFTTKPNGMGMGLSISQTIVESHGGRIWVENNADRGATFRFTLSTTEVGDAA